MGLPICIEKTPWAVPLIQTLQADPEIGSAVVPFEIKGIKKEVRAMASSPYHEGGNFYLPTGKGWTSDFIEEHAVFPNGAHDDWVDTTSMATLRLFKAGLPVVREQRDESGNRRQREERVAGWRKV